MRQKVCVFTRKRMSVITASQNKISTRNLKDLMSTDNNFARKIANQETAPNPLGKKEEKII